MCALVPHGGADGYLRQSTRRTDSIGFLVWNKCRDAQRGVVIASTSMGTHAAAHGRITMAIARGVAVPAFTALVAAADAWNDVGHARFCRHRAGSRLGSLAERYHHRMVMVAVRVHRGWFGGRVGGGGVGIIAAVADVISA